MLVKSKAKFRTFSTCKTKKKLARKARYAEDIVEKSQTMNRWRNWGIKKRRSDIAKKTWIQQQKFLQSFGKNVEKLSSFSKASSQITSEIQDQRRQWLLWQTIELILKKVIDDAVRTVKNMVAFKRTIHAFSGVLKLCTTTITHT